MFSVVKRQKADREIDMEANVEKKKERIEYFDYLKAYAIFLVLVCHREVLFIRMAGIIIPAFLFIAGYNFRLPDGNFAGYVKKQVKRLLVPFWQAMLVYIIMELVRGPLFGYGTAEKTIVSGLLNMIYGAGGKVPCIGSMGQYLREALMAGGQGTMVNLILPTNCQLWFLPVLFSALLIFYFFVKYRNKNIFFDFAFIAGCLLFTFAAARPDLPQLPYSFEVGSYAAAVMAVGYLCRERNFFADENDKKHILGLLFAVPFGVVYRFVNVGWVMSSPEPHGVVINFISGLCYVYLAVMVCKLLCRLPFRRLKLVLSKVGKNTLPIYLWHFVCFFLMDVVYHFIFGAEFSPGPFDIEYFYYGSFLYRWGTILATIAILTLWGERKKKARVYFSPDK